MNSDIENERRELSREFPAILSPYARHMTDIGYMALAAAIGFFLSMAYISSLDDPLKHPYPATLAIAYPAIFFAGGHDMGNAPPESVPGLLDFLSRRTESFDVANIPKNIDITPMTTPFELTHLYQTYAIGFIWRLCGVSIRGLMLYASILCALSAIAFYSVFRLGLSRLGSIIGVLLLCSSPAMLYMSNNLRDFGKTPFILAFLYVMLWLILHPVSTWRLLGLSSFLGVVLGVGIGFRQDMIICLPPAAGVLICFTHVKGKHPWLARLAAGLVFLAVFTPLSRPVFRGAALEGNQASVHSFFQGISPDTESRLDFGGASYDLLRWHDANLYGQANVLARRLGHEAPMINPHTAEYRRAHGGPLAPRLVNPGLYYTGSEYARFARMLMMEVVWHFPADLVARAWRSVVAVFDMPLNMRLMQTRVDAEFPWWLHLVFRLHAILSFLISRFGLICTAVLLVSVSARRFRLALCMTGLLVWFTGYPSMLFEYRHIVYLMFVPVGAALICIEWALKRKKRLWTFNQHVPAINRNEYIKPVANMLCLVLVVLVVVAAPLAILRWWQAGRVHALAEHLAGTTRAPVSVHMEARENLVLAAPLELLPGLIDAEALPPGETAWEYLAATFDTQGADVPVTILYDNRRILHNFTQDILVRGISDGGDGRVTLFFPVYEATTLYTPHLLLDFLDSINIAPWREAIDPTVPLEEQELWRRSKFLGIEFPEAHLETFVGLYTVGSLDDLKLLPIVQLPADITFIRPYKTGPWERALRSCWESRRRWSRLLFGTLFVMIVLGIDWALSRQNRSCLSPRR